MLLHSDINFSVLDHKLKEIVLGKTGYISIFSEDGTILTNRKTDQKDVKDENFWKEIQKENHLLEQFEKTKTFDEFLKKLKISTASPLAELTSGVHFHTILCPDEKCYERILEALKAKGILLETNL